ncbi:hypothetical protein HOY80DRAFT_263607 [Tuber brumale]|nr:hypothetical protein HOY80DRAFT_263607 [Tuber brumale]
MPLCFTKVQVDFDPGVTTRHRQIVIERRRTSTPTSRIPVPVVYPPPPLPAYPLPGTQYALQPQYTETQVILAAPQEQDPEPKPAILNINIDQAASEIAGNLATENMLRNQVAVLEGSLEEERRARGKEASARYQKEVDDIYEAREARRRLRSGGEHRKSRSTEVSVEHREEAARRRISREYLEGRSSSLSRLAPPRHSGERLLLAPEHSNPRHSDDRLAITHTHTRYHTHETRYYSCSHCNRHDHRSHECPEGESEVVRVPVGRVRYWRV